MHGYIVAKLWRAPHNNESLSTTIEFVSLGELKIANKLISNFKSPSALQRQY
jgi:hypothetical protein